MLELYYTFDISNFEQDCGCTHWTAFLSCHVECEPKRGGGAHPFGHLYITPSRLLQIHHIKLRKLSHKENTQCNRHVWQLCRECMLSAQISQERILQPVGDSVTTLPSCGHTVLSLGENTWRLAKQWLCCFFYYQFDKFLRFKTYNKRCIYIAHVHLIAVSSWQITSNPCTL